MARFHHDVRDWLHRLLGPVEHCIGAGARLLDGDGEVVVPVRDLNVVLVPGDECYLVDPGVLVEAISWAKS